MRALVLLAGVEDEAELHELKRPLLDELLSNRTIITCAQPEAVPAPPEELPEDLPEGEGATTA